MKARYADPDGLPKQRLIAKVMERIVRQEIPAAVVNNPLLDWTPETGAVAVSPVKDADAPAGAPRGAARGPRARRALPPLAAASSRPSARPIPSTRDEPDLHRAAAST